MTGELAGGNRLISGIFVLLAVYFAYQLEYPVEIKFPLIFLQEKLLKISEQGKFSKFSSF